MYFKIIALDLDGTIAMDDYIEPATFNVIRNLKKAGHSIILVTGRRLNAIEKLGPFEDLCEAIVAEDGASIYFPSNQSVILPFGHLAPEVVKALYQLNIPLEKGMALVATTMPYNQQVVEAIASTGSAATVEYNKGAVMVLPPGATKGTGLWIALRELGYSIHNVMAFGDAENDRSLFEQAELAVAVRNADPGIKELADILLVKDNGAGVREFLQDLLDKKPLPAFKSRDKRNVVLGNHDDGTPMSIDPLTLTLRNTGIFGSSGSGKSWLGGLISEKLLRMEYQICIIDPEGDYRGLRAFPNTLLLGGVESPPPNGSEVSTLMEYSNMSLVLDLSQYIHEEKINYVHKLMGTLLNLRERRGKPHWFLIDEAHYFCENDQMPVARMLAERMDEGGFTLVSYRPGEIAESILKNLDHLMITQLDHDMQGEKVLSLVCQQEYEPSLHEYLESLTSRQVYFFMKDDVDPCTRRQGTVEIESTRRQVPHIRHLHKYLRAPLPASKHFYFNHRHSDTAIPSASSMYDFLRIIPRVPPQTLAYHLHRGDFESWVYSTLHDEELSRRIRKIANRHLAEDQLTQALTEAVASRYEELELLI
jgi:hydroxymethylpyrimidine pyrophosphatase-like HAD family hydrolase